MDMEMDLNEDDMSLSLCGTSDWEPKINPFLMPHVVQQLFGYLDLTGKELLEFRRVCQVWKEQATILFSAKSTLTLDKKSTIAKFTKAVELIKESFADFPFPTKLEINSSYLVEFIFEFTINYDQISFRRKFKEFLELVAPNLKNLVLKFDIEGVEHYYLKYCEFVPAVTFPKLKSFSFMKNSEMSPCFRMFVNIGSAILSNSPVLEEVKVKIYLGHYGLIMHGQKRICEERNQIVEKLIRKIPATVKKLYLNYKRHPVQESTTECLGEMVLPNLQVLHLELCSGETLDYASFSRIFNGCSRNLIELTVKKYSGGVQFAPMPKLRKLNLEVSSSNVTHQVDAFTNLFPALRSLNLINMKSNTVLNSLFPTGFGAPWVTELAGPAIATPEKMLNLALGFSGLRKLWICPAQLVEGTFAVICGNMYNLEELILCIEPTLNPTCLDSALTGISSKKCKSLLAAKRWNVDLSIVKTNAGLSDLKSLKRLRICRCKKPKNRTQYKPTLTDVTVYYGILQLENLQQLNIKVSGPKITHECAQHLKARFGDNMNTIKLDGGVCSEDLWNGKNFLDAK